ncbi:MAG: phosphotriesterase-related protein, partial [Gaiellales bacterium]|nr:phosphotriesterase-related protein [Gaiellales bacterium]
ARDGERVDAIAALASEGYAEQLLVAQDVWLRQRLLRGGGAGYGHLRRGVVPALKAAGLDPDLVCRRNPLRLLA